MSVGQWVVNSFPMATSTQVLIFSSPAIDKLKSSSAAERRGSFLIFKVQKHSVSKQYSMNNLKWAVGTRFSINICIVWLR